MVVRTPVYRKLDNYAPEGGWGRRQDAFSRRHVNRYYLVVDLADYPELAGQGEALELLVADLIRRGVPQDQWKPLAWPVKAKARKRTDTPPLPAYEATVTTIAVRHDDTEAVELDNGPPGKMPAEIRELVNSLAPQPGRHRYRRPT